MSAGAPPLPIQLDDLEPIRVNYRPIESLPMGVRIGLEYETRGMAAPEVPGRLVEEFRRRGLVAGYRSPTGFDVSVPEQQTRAVQRYQQIQQRFTPQGSDERDNFIRSKRNEWLDQVEGLEHRRLLNITGPPPPPEGYAPGEVIPMAVQVEAREAERVEPGRPLNPIQKDKLFRRLVDTGAIERLEGQWGDEFDGGNTPMGAFFRTREALGQQLLEDYNEQNPGADPTAATRHAQYELARSGFTPSNAGQLKAIIDEEYIRRETGRMQKIGGPIVDQLPDWLGMPLSVPLRAAGTLPQTVGGGLSLLSGLAGQGMEALTGDDYGLRDMTQTLQEYYLNQVERGPLGLSREQGTTGDVKRFLGNIGSGVGTLLQSMVIGGIGAGLAQGAGLAARYQMLAANMAGFGYAGALEGGLQQNTVFQKLISLGYSVEDAQDRAAASGAVVGIINGMLEMVPLQHFLFRNPAAGSRFTAALRGWAVEGQTESAQTLVSIFSEAAVGAGTVLNWDNVWQVLESGLIGGIVGGGAGAVIGPGALRPGVAEQAESEAENVRQLREAIQSKKNEQAQRIAVQEQAPQGQDAQPSPTVEPAPTRDEGGAAPVRRDPKVLVNPKHVGQWYAKTFADPEGAAAIEAMAGMSEERYVIARVPLDQVDDLILGNQKPMNQANIDAIAQLSAEQIDQLPPAIAVPQGEGPLAMADGTHRLLGLRQNPNADTISAYVPQSYANALESGAAPPTVGPVPGPATEGVAPVEGEPGPAPTEIERPRTPDDVVTIPVSLWEAGEWDRTESPVVKDLKTAQRFAFGLVDSSTTYQRDYALIQDGSGGYIVVSRPKVEAAPKPDKPKVEKVEVEQGKEITRIRERSQQLIRELEQLGTVSAALAREGRVTPQLQEELERIRDTEAPPPEGKAPDLERPTPTAERAIAALKEIETLRGEATELSRRGAEFIPELERRQKAREEGAAVLTEQERQQLVTEAQPPTKEPERGTPQEDEGRREEGPEPTAEQEGRPEAEPSGEKGVEGEGETGETVLERGWERVRSAPDGDLWLVSEADIREMRPPMRASFQALRAKIIKEWDSERRVTPVTPKPGKKKAKPSKGPKPTRPGRVETVAQVRKLVGKFVAKEGGRHPGLVGVYVRADGQTLIASAGTMMIEVTDTSAEYGPEGMHTVTSAGGVQALDLGEGVKPPPHFAEDDPRFRTWLDATGEGTLSFEQLDALITANRQMRAMTDETGARVILMQNPDGSFGLHASGEFGAGEHNVHEGATVVGGYSGKLLAQALEAHYSNSRTGREFKVAVGLSPLGQKDAPDAVTLALTSTKDTRTVRTIVAPRGGPAEAPTKAEPEPTEQEPTEEAGMPAPTEPGDAAPGFDPDSGRTIVVATGRGVAGMPAITDVTQKPPGAPGGELPVSGAYTNDLNPLTAPEGKFRRQPGDQPGRIKKQTAAVQRATRDGTRAKKDDIYAIISDMARRFNVGPPGIARKRVLRRHALGIYQVHPPTQSIRLRAGSYISVFFHELGHHLHLVMFPRATRPDKSDLSKTGRVAKTISAYDFPKQWRGELATLGKDLYGDKQPNVGGYATEGWAEVVRLLMVNPNHLKARAPTVYQGVVSHLVREHPEVWMALMNGRARLLNSVMFAGENPVNQFVAHNPRRDWTWRNLWDTFRIAWPDRMQRAHTFNQDLNLENLPADKDPHTLSLRSYGKISGDLGLMVETGTFDPARPWVKTGPGFSEILEPVNNHLEVWQDYMVARRALEKRGQGYERVLAQDPMLPPQTSKAQLEKFIRESEDTHPQWGDYFKRRGHTETRTEVDEEGKQISVEVPVEDPGTVAPRFRVFNRWVVQTYAVHHGLITPQVAQMIVDKNLEYITFRHKKTEDAMAQRLGPMGAQKFTGMTSGFRRFREGYGEQLFPPLESFTMAMQGIVSRARLNEVALGFYNIHKAGVPGVGQWFDKIDPAMEAQVVGGERLGKEVQKQLGIKLVTRAGQMVVMAEKDSPVSGMSDEDIMELAIALDQMQKATFWKPGNRTDRDNLEVTVLVDGEPIHLEVRDRRLFNLLEGLNNPYVAGVTLRVLGFPMKVLRAGATRLNLSFAIPNFSRDTLGALTMTQAELSKLPTVTRDRLRGMRAAFFGGDIATMYRASGAEMSGLFGEFYNPISKRIDLEKMFEKPKLLGLVKGRNTKRIVLDLLKFGPIDRLNQAFELANRMGEFEAIRAGRETPEAVAEAGQAAADITLDFQRGGTWSKQLNQFIPFFNAAIIGADKLGRFIKQNPTRAAGMILSTQIIPSIVVMLLNIDNEDYWSKPWEQRDRYWYIPTGSDDEGRPTYFKIAKPYGLGAFAVATERSMAAAFGINPENPTGPRGDPRALGTSALVGILRELRPSINFAGFQTVAEVMMGDQGYSFYRDREIVSTADKDLPLGQQGATRSSDFGRFLGEFLGYPPAKIDYLIQGFFGGLGRDITSTVIDPLVRTLDPSAKEGEPIEFHDWMIVRRFLAGHTRSNHEAIRRFFDDYQHFKKVSRGLSALEDQPDRAGDYETRHAVELDLWADYSTAYRDMADGFRELRHLYRTPDLDADQLDAQISELYDGIIEIARETLTIRAEARP